MDMGAPWRALEVPEGGADGAASESGRAQPLLAGRRLAILAAALLAVGSFAVAGILAARPSGQVQIVGASDTGGAGNGSWTGPSASQATIVVQVAGAVMRPGVYSLPPGSRVADAIAAAGGYAPDVDPRIAETRLNLAAKLQDAQLILVPRRGDAGNGGTTPTGSAGTAAGPVNLNTATAEQLDTLPGIGPATAQKIIAAREERPFASLDDLLSRKVVTAATLAKLRPLATVD
jgi:competence protein ComEA